MSHTTSDFDDDIVTNVSNNPQFSDLLESATTRRKVLAGGMGVAASAFIGTSALAVASKAHAAPGSNRLGGLGFDAIPKSLADVVSVPEGYSVQVLYALGDPLKAGIPAYKNDGTDGDFEYRSGDHHDGMHYFPLKPDGSVGGVSSRRGLICVNHENITEAFLHPNGPTYDESGNRPVASEVEKEMNAHGVAVFEVRKTRSGGFEVAKNSRYNRRITPFTPMALSGPVAGSDLVKTKYSPAGTATRGTLNNCANGYTPWGTYLTCEENWAFYFRREAGDNASRPAKEITSLNRYGISEGSPGNYGWSTLPEDRFARLNITISGGSATSDYRYEANTYGWVVEIDPANPDSIPKKRTALGRFGHEGAWIAPAVAGQPIVIYSGDDSRGEYIYKFVSDALYDPSDRGADAGDKYLDAGTLYVAKFEETGLGVWMPLTYGLNGLDGSNETYAFADQADVLINTRLAADTLGATKMDRPEWGAVSPVNGEVYMTLTNNSRRGSSYPVDAANPRDYGPGNTNGHIIRWREAGSYAAATSFEWDIFVFAARATDDTSLINLSELDDSNDLSSPDGLWFDRRGLLWIQTDDGAYTDVTNCMMLVADPGTVGDGEVISVDSQTSYKGANPGSSLRRFLVGPSQCEITGITMTPDAKALFVNIQHPGERTSGLAYGDPSTFGSHWPESQAGGSGTSRPRSATIVITRDDGGAIAL